MKHQIVFFFAFLIQVTFTFSQTPYEVNWKKELPFIATGIGTVGAGAYFNSLTPLFTPDELLTLNADDVNAFDRIATGNFSESAHQLSDVFWIGSHLTPALFLLDTKNRSSLGQIVVMYGEAATINFGLTVMTKSLFRRPRPFVFNQEVVEELKLTRSAKASFVSGHTSMTAVNAFFVAKVFSDLHPDSPWKPWIWGAAATIPAVTGYLRVAAGKHYPTDVIAGYVMGATIGIVVPQFHHSKELEKKGLSLDMGYESIRLTWKFNQISNE